MHERKILISVIMPVLNAERTVVQATKSIQLQTYDNWELIIVDDGSSDSTVRLIKLIKESRLVLYSDGEHKGLPQRLNEAVMHARGAYIARMDADDIAYPEKLEVQLRYLTAHPDVDLLATAMIVFDDDGGVMGKRYAPLKNVWYYKLRILTVPMAHPTFMGKTEWFRTHPYPESMKYSEDQQLLLTSMNESKIAILPEILHGYRENSLSVDKQLRYRMSQVLSLGLIKEGFSILESAIGIGVLSVKTAYELFAISIGLQKYLLFHRNRAGAVSIVEKTKWRGIWEKINGLALNENKLN